MLLRLLTLVVILTLCVTALSGCKGKDEGGTVVENWKKVMGEICDVLNSIDDKESAEEAIPKLKELQEKYSFIKDVRGQGLIIGMELDIEGGALVVKAMERGLLINCTVGNVWRFVPPLIVSRAEIDEAMTILDEVLAAAS